MQREIRDLQTAVGQMKARLAAFEAQSYLERAETKGDRTFVGAVVPEANAEAMRHLRERFAVVFRAASSRSPASTTAR